MSLPMTSGRCYTTEADVIAYICFILWLMLLPFFVADVITTCYLVYYLADVIAR